MDDNTPLAALYEDIEPKPDIYGTIDDARRQIRTLTGFSEALLADPEFARPKMPEPLQ
jgi:hypothetical protein